MSSRVELVPGRRPVLGVRVRRAPCVRELTRESLPGLFNVVKSTALNTRRRCAMKVFVAGGTGAIGSQLVPQLVGAGHEVAATTRSEKGAAAIREMGAEPAIVDGLDEQGMVETVKRAQPEAVIHEMTAL